MPLRRNAGAYLVNERPDFYCRFYCAERYGLTRDGAAELRSAAKRQLKGTIWYAAGRDQTAI